jgi:hypothetical protein
MKFSGFFFCLVVCFSIAYLVVATFNALFYKLGGRFCLFFWQKQPVARSIGALGSNYFQPQLNQHKSRVANL